MTPAQALRKADAPAAGAAIGVRVPPKTRSAADIPELHGPWSVAVATGLVRISDGTVTATTKAPSSAPAEPSADGPAVMAKRAKKKGKTGQK